jgi:hypothetical protein
MSTAFLYYKYPLKKRIFLNNSLFMYVIVNTSEKTTSNLWINGYYSTIFPMSEYVINENEVDIVELKKTIDNHKNLLLKEIQVTVNLNDLINEISELKISNEVNRVFIEALITRSNEKEVLNISDIIKEIESKIETNITEVTKDEFYNLKKTVEENLSNLKNENINKEIGKIVFSDWCPNDETYLELNGQCVFKEMFLELWEKVLLNNCIGHKSTDFKNINEDLFQLPDFGGTFLLPSSKKYNLFDIGGEESHKLTLSEMPTHSHPPDNTGSREFFDRMPNGNGAYPGYAAGTWSSDGGFDSYSSTGSVGGGKSHNNMPPYRVSKAWIKAK